MEQKKTGKKILAGTVGLLLVAVIFLSAFTGRGNAAQESATETVYRETTVLRGDITVGVSETATATLKTHNLSFDITAEIEEVYVKAGQTVSQGDPLVLLASSGIQEQLSDLQADYQEALAELTEAEVARQKGELEARLTYDSTVNKSGTADSSYELTIEKLQRAVEKAKNEVEDLETEIRTYTKMLSNLNDYDEVIDNYIANKEWYEDAQEWVSSAQDLLNDHKKSEHGGATQDGCAECTRLQENLDNAKADLAYAKLEHEDTSKSFSNKYYSTTLTDEDDIRDARDDARERLVDAEAALKEAEYNLEAQTIDAGQTMEESLARAELAESTYEMELIRLENNVTSKQVLVDNFSEQIAKYNGYLQNNLLVAPCNGIVTSVSYPDPGTEVNGGTTIVTVSDSENVFVYVTIAQDDIANISLGQEATLVMDAFDEITFAGEVDSITTTPVRSANGSASYSVTIKAIGDTSQIYEGMTGSVTLITRQQKDVLYVSNRCVNQRDGGYYVKVKQEDGDIVEIPVETGFSDGRNVEIVSGLTQGQTVLIESQVVSA